MSRVEHIEGHTWHCRKGVIGNAFRYAVDFVLLDAEARPRAPWPFSRNRANLLSLHDTDHGGAPGRGRGAAWAREVLEAHQVRAAGRLLLLAQPRTLGHVFNPVAFWLAHDEAGALVAVIAEVSNTYGDRHSYLCLEPDRSAILPADTLTARKIFHVSPFQPVEGGYAFRFDITADHVGVRIDYSAGEGGLIATMCGPRHPMTGASVARALLRRPFGTRRVLALIHWQALKLWWKGARFRSRPGPPLEDVSH